VLELLALAVFLAVGAWALLERAWMVALLAAGLVVLALASPEVHFR
jgi:hypothetical protein